MYKKKQSGGRYGAKKASQNKTGKKGGYRSSAKGKKRRMKGKK